MKKNALDLSGKWSFSFACHDELIRLGYVKDGDPELSAPALFVRDGMPFPTYPADVPGNFELDLYKAGLGPDPYFGTNTLEYRKYETYHLFYRREFVYDGGSSGVYLRFDGVDAAADIYLNGELIMRTENAFIPHEAPCSCLIPGKNRLDVHIKPAKLYVNKYPSTEGAAALEYLRPFLQLRKPASAAGWDIAPRFPCGGIWRGVRLVKKEAPYIDDVFIYTERLEDGDAFMRARVSAVCPAGCAAEAVVSGRCGDSSFEVRASLTDGEADVRFKVPDARLWYPKNYGEPELYDTETALYADGVKADVFELRTGVRTVKLDRSEENGGRFDFYVNGERVFIMGTNWVPADAFHSRDRERVREITPLLGDIGCNCVRCWGGGVYECKEFFDYCDEHGVLVWQDFMMACGVYPTDGDFIARLSAEAEAVVREYRNHPCLLIWAGDNECDQVAAYNAGKDPNENALTRKVLPDIVSALDPSRPFLPSSPYIDETAYARGTLLSEDHFWGPRDYYKGDYYRNAAAKFASETGYHGCPSPGSLMKFIPAGAAKSFRGEDGGIRAEWLIHGSSPVTDPEAPFAYRTGLMAAQVKELLGYVPEDAGEFSAASQFSQAEAMKYFIERMRLRKSDHGGIIWWNLTDCWPQISDSVTDYYLEKKLAYHVIKNIQSPVVIMADEPEDGVVTAVADSELCCAVTVGYIIYPYGEPAAASGSVRIEAHSRAVIGKLACKGPLVFEWEYTLGGAVVRGRSHYAADARGKTLDFLAALYSAAGYGDVL